MDATLDHYTVDGAVVHHDVCKITAKQGRDCIRSHEISIKKRKLGVRTPSSEGDGVPFLDLEVIALLATAVSAGGGGRGQSHGDAALVHQQGSSNDPRGTARRGEEATLSTLDGARFIVGWTLKGNGARRREGGRKGGSSRRRRRWPCEREERQVQFWMTWIDSRPGFIYRDSCRWRSEYVVSHSSNR
jgi:hypothetical protein